MNIKRTFKWKMKWNEMNIWVLYLNLTYAHAASGGQSLYHFSRNKNGEKLFNNSFVLLREKVFLKISRPRKVLLKFIIVWHRFSLISLLTASFRGAKIVCTAQKCVLSLYKISCSKRRIYATECVFHLMTTKKVCRIGHINEAFTISSLLDHIKLGL